jgi:sec-independent protein translocase protein TatA
VPNLGLPELLVILVIVILIFGAGKIPQLGKGLGEGIKNFKDSMREGQSGDSKDGSKNEKNDGASKPK